MADLLDARDLIGQTGILLKAVEMAAAALADREERNAIAEVAALARDKLDEAKAVLEHLNNQNAMTDSEGASVRIRKGSS